MNIPSIEAPRSNDPSGGPLSTSMERSPAFPGSGSQQRTPMSYELQSPASNASSYLRSVDPQGTISGIPEVCNRFLTLSTDQVLQHDAYTMAYHRVFFCTHG